MRRYYYLMSPTHTILHPPLYLCNIPGSDPKETGCCKAVMDRFIILIASRRIVPRRHIYSLHPLLPSYHTVLRQRNPFTSHHRKAIQMCNKQMYPTTIHHSQEQNQRRIHRTWRDRESLGMCSGGRQVMCCIPLTTFLQRLHFTCDSLLQGKVVNHPQH